MPKNEFARLFNLAHGQVIVHKAYDSDDAECPYLIKAITDVKGVCLTTSFGFYTQEDRDNAFIEFPIATARKILNIALKSTGASEREEVANG